MASEGASFVEEVMEVHGLSESSSLSIPPPPAKVASKSLSASLCERYRLKLPASVLLAAESPVPPATKRSPCTNGHLSPRTQPFSVRVWKKHGVVAGLRCFFGRRRCCCWAAGASPIAALSASMALSEQLAWRASLAALRLLQFESTGSGFKEAPVAGGTPPLVLPDTEGPESDA